jgi:carboxyl-terminal processing protease
MPKRNLIWLAALVAAAVAAVLIARAHPRRIYEKYVQVEFDPVTQAYRTIQERYFYPVDDDLLRRRAMEGMVSPLDPYSTYIPPSGAEAFADRMAGTAWGLGLKVEAFPDGNVVVVGALVNSPAQHSGLLRGDRIIKIDGNAVAGLSQAAVEGMLDGPAPAPAALLVRRGGNPERVVSCPRGKFPLETVHGLSRGPTGQWDCLLEGDAGVAYVRVREILPGTPEQLRGALRRLDRFHALVLDLRGNPGGDLLAAVELAGLFVSEGPIVTVIDRHGSTPHAATQDRRAVAPGVRVVVLVDQTTASAAELVAGALAWRDRAVLVGRRTLGKGCVQSMITLEGGLGRLNLTTAEFWVDPQRPIQRRKDSNSWGVDPHVEVAMPPGLAATLEGLRTRAEVVQPPPGTMPATTHPATDDNPGALLLRLDPQLKKAVDLAGEAAEVADLLRSAAQAREARTRPATLPSATAPPASPPLPPAATRPSHE